MKVLVANLGSTSFKYRLFDITEAGETLLAKGGYERVENFGEVIEDCVRSLEEDAHLAPMGADLDAVGFKCVVGGEVSGCLEADQTVLDALEKFREVAPAHNPAYANGIKQFAKVMPNVPRVALFETAFYQWTPEPTRHYAVPKNWRDAGIRRYGFHGASHKFIAERSAQLIGREDIVEKVQHLYQQGNTDITEKPLRVISCHLGGSSSVTGIHNGVAIGSSMGFSPQGGLPQNNRVGDLDTMAIPFMMKTQGLSLEECEHQLTKEGGLLGLSGAGNDIRDVKDAASKGNQDARLALEIQIREIRRWVGSFFFEMGGADIIAFTGGIGEYNPDVRAGVCRGLEELGIAVDGRLNGALMGTEGFISANGARTRIAVIPANEEVVIAREVFRFMQSRNAGKSGVNREKAEVNT
ncbi:hypothetical protein [Rubellicoccus peritrichatus]|uniref:Acetate kinase n=1 Tax=Rubellicoccus peritrichatus TaxID=3080537 RepID=A0AAQ3QW57_9BACT|nr:hypothetical protein [Puniceicoccus sp. CR14]WOO41565.1 hypothetical protein RZN69_00590 [Puniceicoccus sp. CR14]